MEKIIFRIIMIALKSISPELRNVLAGVYNTLKKQADATDNKFDDVLVRILGALFDLE
ncbi:hypothetical protein ES705_26738 [subsurface metagenome]